ncbi:hypothetical protein BG418_04290 [Streptomyces sp. CBMA152]|nr:hypothetical protein [Streptomyces sp. CBMA152]
MLHEPDLGAHPDFARLRHYLGALVTRRTAPVHTAVAFNAVYFGFDTEAGGYAGGPLDIGDFPSVALDDEVEALPVGAMINVRTGGDLLPAEVIYKEGAHRDLGSAGDVPTWLSGAPSGAQGPGMLAAVESPTMRERLVFDAGAFGQGLAATSQRLARLSRRRTTDEYGHLLVEARYRRPESDLDDTSYYARYLMTRGRDQLTSSLAPMPLPLMLPPTSTPDELEAALLRLMCVVRQALASSPDLRMWGDYAFTRTSMAARLADPGPLGRDALEALAHSVARSAVPIGTRRAAAQKKVVYTALGPALRALPQASGLLRETAYPLAISHANVLLTDYARGEADEDTGLLPNGVHMTLDDRWQGGGVWRVEYAADEGPGRLPLGSLGEPAGRGWTESCVPTPPATSLHPVARPEAVKPSPRVPDAEPDPDDAELWPDDRGLGDPVPASAEPDRIEWTQPLRSAHRTFGCLPLPQDVLAGLALPGFPDEDVQVRMSHDGRTLPSRWSSQCARIDKEGRLTGLRWPDEFFPGILLTSTWRRDSRTVNIRTRLLSRPQTVDGQPVAHRYDRRVRTRDGVDTPRRGPAVGAWTDTESLVMIAVRRLGLLDVYGRALLARERLHPAIGLVMADAPVRPTAPGVERALVALLATGRLTTVCGSRGADGRPHYPPKPYEAGLELVCYTPLVVEDRPRGGNGADEPAKAGRLVTRYHVPGFLRLIGHLGHEASDEQRRLFRQDFLTFGLAGTPEIPPGYTYVRPHERGS